MLQRTRAASPDVTGRIGMVGLAAPAAAAAASAAGAEVDTFYVCLLDNFMLSRSLKI